MSLDSIFWTNDKFVGYVKKIYHTHAHKYKVLSFKSDLCLRCGKHNELKLHLVQDCESVADLWLSIVNARKWQEFFFYKHAELANK